MGWTRVTQDVCPQTGKVMYGTKSAASSAKAGVLSRKGRKTMSWNVYRCAECQTWHIGRKQQKRRIR